MGRDWGGIGFRLRQELRNGARWMVAAPQPVSDLSPLPLPDGEALAEKLKGTQALIDSH